MDPMAGPTFLSREKRREQFGIDCAESLLWKNWEPGGEYTRTIVVKNYSDKTEKIKYKLPASKHFTMDFPETIKLSQGMGVSIVVTFRPVKLEQYDDFIEFSCSSGVFYVPVRARLPFVALKVPPTLDFGYCPAKEVTTQTFSFTNTGELDVKYEWKLDHPFELEPSSGIIQPGDTHTVSATFKPEDASVFVATAACMVVGTDDMVIMQVHGIGKYPYICLSEQVVDFGEIMVGKVAEKVIELQNQSLVEASYSVAREETEHDKVFALTPIVGTVPAGQVESVKLTYTPSATGTFSCENMIFSTPGGNATKVCLKGVATGPDCTLSTTSINFGNVSSGTSTSRVIYIENSSDLPVGFQLCADSLGVFKFDRTQGTCGPSSSVHVTVTFSPLEPANYHKRLVVLVKDRSPLVVDILGTCYSDKRHPPPLAQRHVDAYYWRALAGLPPVPKPEELEETALEVNELDMQKRWIDNLKDQGLWDELFKPDFNKPISLEPKTVNFGACSRLRMSDYKQVTVQNNTNSKITSFWVVPTDPDGASSGEDPSPAFTVFPEQADIKPGGSVVFRIAFRPTKDAHYSYQRLECYSYVKAMRHFRLVTEETFSPPWCMTLDVAGHTFMGGGEEFMPKAEFTAKALQLPPCEVGSTSYNQVALVNNGDTPVRFEFPDFGKTTASGNLSQRVFECLPQSGVIPSHQFVLVAFQFIAITSGTFTDRVRCVLNNSPGNVLELDLSAVGCYPRLKMENHSVFFKPTCVGAISKRAVQLQNVSRVPVHYKWAIPDRLVGTFHIEPSIGTLLGNEKTMIQWSFTPLKQKSYNAKIQCQYTSTAEEGVSPEDTDDKGRMVVGALGEGTPGAVTIEPAVLDFTTVVVGQTKTMQVEIFNHSSGNLHYALDLALVSRSGTLQAAAGVLEIDHPVGVLQARSLKRVKLTFSPVARVNYTFTIHCRTSSGTDPLAPLTEEPSTALVAGSPEFNVPLPSVEILARGDYPCLEVADVRCDGLGKRTLWQQMGVSALNAELAEVLTEGEHSINAKIKAVGTCSVVDMLDKLKPFEVSFAAAPLGAEPTTIHVQLKNTGAMALQWSLGMRVDQEVELENWVDIGEPQSAADKHQAHILQNKIFDVYPRAGALHPGEACVVSCTYLHEDMGEHRLPVLLEVGEGKRVNLNLMGRTLEPDAKLLYFTGTEHHFAPVQIGDKEAAIQSYELRNVSAENIAYSVDIGPCDDLTRASYGFQVLECLNPQGIVPAGGAALIEWRFQPIEAATYMLDIPITVQGGDTTVVTFKGRGYHPAIPGTDKLLPEEESGNKALWPGWKGVQTLPVAQVAGQHVELSQETLSFGQVPALSVTRHILTVKNHSPSQEYLFEWDLSVLRPVEGSLVVEPPAGTLAPNATCICKVTYTAGNTPHSFDTEVLLKLAPVAPPPTPPPPPPEEELLHVHGTDFEPKRAPTKVERVSVAHTTTTSTLQKFPGQSMYPVKPTGFATTFNMASATQTRRDQLAGSAPVVLKLGVDVDVRSETQFRREHVDKAAFERHYIPSPSLLTDREEKDMVTSVDDGMADLMMGMLLEALTHPDVTDTIDGLMCRKPPAYRQMGADYVDVPLQLPVEQHESPAVGPPQERKPPPSEAEVMAAEKLAKREELVKDKDFTRLVEHVLEGTLFNIVKETHKTGSII